jgi:predicted RNA binding protein YcfA (HicA-like mRNA interferase family)
MPKLRRQNGKEVVAILQSFGFTVEYIRGSHHRLRRAVEGQNQSISVPVHGNKPLKVGTLKSIFRQACRYIDEKAIRPFFYTD